MPFTTEIMAIDIPAAISPYSIAVAAVLSARNHLKKSTTKAFLTAVRVCSSLRSHKLRKMRLERDAEKAASDLIRAEAGRAKGWCSQKAGAPNCFDLKRLRFNKRRPGAQALSGYRENFLYLIRCGRIESVPSRRILSFS
jgi:hypothetical protein